MRGTTELFEALTAEYRDWCKAQGLRSDLSADELQCEPEVNAEQSRWLLNFIERWREAEQAERDEVSKL